MDVRMLGSREDSASLATTVEHRFSVHIHISEYHEDWCKLGRYNPHCQRDVLN